MDNSEKKPVKTRKWAWWALGIIALLAIIGALNDNDSKKSMLSATNPSSVQGSTKPETYQEISASFLRHEYDDNEVAADRKYKGKVFIVTGSAANIGKDILNTPYVLIGDVDDVFGVQCMFSKNQEGALAQLSKGQDVKIRGRISGKVGSIILRECSLL